MNNFFISNLFGKDLILSEGKLDLLQKKYPDIDVKKLYDSDPSPTKKYVEWMIKQVIAGFKEEDIIPSIEAFHKNQTRLSEKDINKYTAKTLEDAIKDLGMSSTKKRQIAKAEGTEKIYEDDQSLVLRMDTKEACIFYGSNTRWCITMANESYYEQYKQSNVVFYFILSKKKRNDGLNKVAIAYQRGENNEIIQTDIFDEHDNNITQEISDGISEKINIKNFPKIGEVTRNDAVKQPKAFLAKIGSEKYTREELINYLKANNLNKEDNSAEEDDSIIRFLISKIRTEDLDLFLGYNKNNQIIAELLGRFIRDKEYEYDNSRDDRELFNPPTSWIVHNVIFNDHLHPHDRYSAMVSIPQKDFEKIFYGVGKKLKKIISTLESILNNLKQNELFGEKREYTAVVEFIFEKLILNNMLKLIKPNVSQSAVDDFIYSKRNMLINPNGLNGFTFYNKIDEKTKKLMVDFLNLTKKFISLVMNKFYDILKTGFNRKLVMESKLKDMFIPEWSQHLDHVMFSAEDTNIEDPDRPEDELDAWDPFDSDDSLRTTQLGSALGIRTKVAGGSGTGLSARFPGGKNQSVGAGK